MTTAAVSDGMVGKGSFIEAWRQTWRACWGGYKARREIVAHCIVSEPIFTHLCKIIDAERLEKYQNEEYIDPNLMCYMVGHRNGLIFRKGESIHEVEIVHEDKLIMRVLLSFDEVKRVTAMQLTDLW